MANPQNMVPSEVSNIRFWDGSPRLEMGLFLLGTHDRLGSSSPTRILKSSSEVLQYIYSSFLHLPKLSALKRMEERLHDTKLIVFGESVTLSPCAAYHLVQGLTENQLEARYPAGCEERWGMMNGGHAYDKDGREGIPLRSLLESHNEPCATCRCNG